jgi:hypothetical protein
MEKAGSYDLQPIIENGAILLAGENISAADYVELCEGTMERVKDISKSSISEKEKVAQIQEYLCQLAKSISSFSNGAKNLCNEAQQRTSEDSKFWLRVKDGFRILLLLLNTWLIIDVISF